MEDNEKDCRLNTTARNRGGYNASLQVSKPSKKKTSYHTYNGFGMVCVLSAH